MIILKPFLEKEGGLPRYSKFPLLVALSLSALVSLHDKSYLSSSSNTVQVFAAQALHSPNWDPVLTVSSALSDATRSTLWNQGRAAALNALAEGDAPFYIDYLPLQPNETTSLGGSAIEAEKKVVTVEFATAGVCVGYNINGAVSSSLTLPQLAYLLAGNHTAFDATGGSALIPDSRAITIVLPSGTAAPLLTLVRDSLDASTAAGQWWTEGQALSNPKLSLAIEDELEVLKYVKATNNTITLSSVVLAVKNALPCLQLRVQHPTYPSVTVLTSPGSHTTENAVADYPLVQDAYMFGSVAYSCAHREENAYFKQLKVFVAESSAETMRLWGIKSSAAAQQLTALTKSFENALLCGDATTIPGDGSSAILPLAEAWSIQYLTSGSQESSVSSDTVGTNSTATTASSGSIVLLDYPGGGSGAGLRGIKSRSLQIAGSDSLFTEEEYTEYPTVQFVPATTFAVSIIVNIPGARSLTLTRCVAVAIFSGQILFWDHPLIALHNPSILLPRARINVFARSTRSGTTGIFLEGLSGMHQTCLGLDPAVSGRLLTDVDFAAVPVNGTSTWNLFFPGLNLETGTSEVVQGVANTDYSVGYASVGAAREAGLVEATLLDDETLSVTAPSIKTVTAALEGATLDPLRLTLNFTISPTAYPMVGVTYWVYHQTQTGNCTRMKHALDILKWSQADAGPASRTAEALFYVPIPASIATAAQLRISAVTTCDGAVLFPLPVPPAAVKVDQTPLIIGLVLAALVIVGLVVAVLLLGVGKGKGRQNKAAPKDDTKPVSIIFTDIESSTMLWARGPTAMGPALDMHNKVIRKVIAHHEAYEVKTIGDAFMIACSSAEQAVALASDCQLALKDADWGKENEEEIEQLYHELHSTAEGGAPLSVQNSFVEAPELHSEIWGGLRVRMGIATGPCSIRLDEITGGYDYFGNTCNLASRIESAGHGGQVLVCSETAKAVKKNQTLDYIELGTAELKGIDEPTPLFQALPIRLKKRRFPPLRMNKAGRLEEDDEEDGESTEGGTVPWAAAYGADGGSVRSASYIAPKGGPGWVDDSSNANKDETRSRGSVFGSLIDGGRRNQHAPSGTNNLLDVALSVASEPERQAMIQTLCQLWRIPYNKKKSTKCMSQLVGRVTGVLSARQQQRNTSSRSSASGGRRSLVIRTSVQSFSVSGAASPVARSDGGDDARSPELLSPVSVAQGEALRTRSSLGPLSD